MRGPSPRTTTIWIKSLTSMSHPAALQFCRSPSRFSLFQRPDRDVTAGRLLRFCELDRGVALAGAAFLITNPNPLT